MISDEQAREIKRRHSAALLGRTGVSGVGIEKDAAGKPVLTIHIDSDNAELPASLPQNIEGLQVRVIRGGPFRKL